MQVNPSQGFTNDNACDITAVQRSAMASSLVFDLPIEVLYNSYPVIQQ